MTSAQEQSRAERLRQYEQTVDAAARVVAVMGAVVRAREARGWGDSEPPEIAFADWADGNGRSLPAGVFVALRRDDPTTVVDALVAVSEEPFLIAQREEMGDGYRLQTVEETRPVPDVDLLLAQLSAVLDIPADVLGVLGQWGVDDPRTAGEVNALLDSRFGASGTRPQTPLVPGRPSGAPAETDGGGTPAGIGLTMTVQETADVLQLTEPQTKVLATLVRRTGVTITP